jgi:hypothetical protein
LYSSSNIIIGIINKEGEMGRACSQKEIRPLRLRRKWEDIDLDLKRDRMGWYGLA